MSNSRRKDSGLPPDFSQEPISISRFQLQDEGGAGPPLPLDSRTRTNANANSDGYQSSGPLNLMRADIVIVCCTDLIN